MSDGEALQALVNLVIYDESLPDFVGHAQHRGNLVGGLEFVICFNIKQGLDLLPEFLVWAQTAIREYRAGDLSKWRPEADTHVAPAQLLDLLGA